MFALVAVSCTGRSNQVVVIRLNHDSESLLLGVESEVGKLIKPRVQNYKYSYHFSRGEAVLRIFFDSDYSFSSDFVDDLHEATREQIVDVTVK